MVGTPTNGRARLSFSLVNGGQELCLTSTPTSIAGSDCGGIEFTKEDVEALLNEKLKRKDRFNLKVSPSFSAVKVISELRPFFFFFLYGWFLFPLALFTLVDSQNVRSGLLEFGKTLVGIAF